MSSKKCEWKSDEDTILIDFVKNHELLYNVKCKDYRKTQLKQNCWREIGETLNKTVVECTKRWAYIRDYYIRRKGKPGTGSSGEAAKKRAEQLSFVYSSCSITKSSITNIEDSNSEIKTENVDLFDENSSKDLEENLLMQEENANSQTEILFEEVKCSNNETYRDNLRQTKKRKPTQRLKSLKRMAEKPPHPLSEEKDETDLFFEAMAKIVKKLPSSERVHLRLQIGSIIGIAELKNLSSHNYYSRPASAATCSSYSYQDQDVYSPASSCYASNNTTTAVPNDFEDFPNNDLN